MRRTVLYQGGPGSGKSHCSLTWPKPLVIYCEENTATLEKFTHLEEGRVVFPSDWGDTFTSFRNNVVPLIKNRQAHLMLSEYDDDGALVKEADPGSVETIVIDAVSSLLFDLEREVVQPYAGGKIPHSTTGPKFLYQAEEVMRDIVGAAKPYADKPCYNIICTTHLKDVTDESGNLVKISPAIYGQMKDLLTRWFDTKLLCEAVKKSGGDVDKPEGGKTKEKVPIRYVYTVSPNNYYSVGDGVGGEGGPYKELEYITGGTYQDLMKAWGVSTEDPS